MKGGWRREGSGRDTGGRATGSDRRQGGNARGAGGHVRRHRGGLVGASRIEVTPAQVCILLIDLKTCRAWGNPGHADNWIDVAGYAACGGEVAG